MSWNTLEIEFASAGSLTLVSFRGLHRESCTGIHIMQPWEIPYAVKLFTHHSLQCVHLQDTQTTSQEEDGKLWGGGLLWCTQEGQDIATTLWMNSIHFRWDSWVYCSTKLRCGNFLDSWVFCSTQLNNVSTYCLVWWRSKVSLCILYYTAKGLHKDCTTLLSC